MKSILAIFLFCALSLSAQVNCNYWSTYIGKSGSDEVRGITSDNNKNSYVIMQTDSPNLPTTPGLISTTLTGFYDAYIAKFDSCGAFVWGTYLGTANFDSGEKIVVCADGNIAFTGYSQDVNLPTTAGCFQSSFGGQMDCFVGKITPNGNLLWLTYFGKTGSDLAYDVSCDPFNNLFIGGTTTSTNLYVTASSFQQTFGGNTDAFIAKFSSTGAFRWCSYYGGNGSEDIHALTSDVNGNVIGSGGTFSFNLYTTTACLQPSKDAGMDCYILKLDSVGNEVFATYLGGNSQDDAFGLATDGAGGVYISGQTASTNFTVTASATQTNIAGMSDIYFAKLSPTGSMIYSTFLGGTDNEFVSRMKFYNNKLYVYGITSSSNIPMYGTPNYSVLPGAQSLIIYRFTTSGMPDFSTYFGSVNGTDYANDISVKNNHLFFCGKSSSANYPTSSGAFQLNYDSNDDGILTRMPIGGGAIITDINAFSKNPELVFYPNPAKDILYTNSEKILIELFDATGKLILLKEISKTEPLKMTDLSSGIYYLKSSKGNKKIVKEN